MQVQDQISGKNSHQPVEQMELHSAPKIAAVIVGYNGASWLQACLDSLNNSATPISMIFVIDNASTDDTVSIARSTRNVSLIETGNNIGFGRANNIGIAKALDAGAEFVFLLNQDAHVAPDAMTKLIAEAHAHPDVGIFCPMQLNDTGHSIDPTFLKYYLAQNAPALINDAFLSHVGNYYPVAAAPAAAWLLSRELLMTAGGFDPLFFMYGEDDDLCARARHHGFGIAIVPQARFYHCRGLHGHDAQESKVRKIRRRASRLRSGLVRDIKNPFGNFSSNVWHAMIPSLFEGLGVSLNYLDWADGIAHFAAMTKVLTELPRIANHRATCRRPGPHWLPLARQHDESQAVDS